MRANRNLNRLVADSAIVGTQGSVRLDEFAEPQPDIYLLRPKDDFYASAHAGPSDILLIVEMADSSLEYDQEVKKDLYALTGVPEYWIADIHHDCVIVYSDLRDNRYQRAETFSRGNSMTPCLLPDCRIPVDVLLP